MHKHPKIRYFESTPLKPPPLYGVFQRWPEDGEDWIHPFDVGVARHLLPGNRIFRRAEFDGEFFAFRYGQLMFRARPRIWLIVEHQGFDIGDQVEIRSLMGKNWPQIATINQMLWNSAKRRIEYFVQGVDRSVEKPLQATEIQLVHDLQNAAGKFPPRNPPLNSLASFINRRNG